MAGVTQKCGVLEILFYAERVSLVHTQVLSGCGLL